MTPNPPLPISPADRNAEQLRLSAAYAERTAAEYDTWLEPAHRFILQERERRTLDLFRREGITSLGALRILEIGCGTGNWLRDLVRWGASPGKLVGVDLLADRVAAARRLTAPGVTIDQGDITALTYPAASFDLVIQSTVFSSILDTDRRARTATEILRVLTPSGMILWYDFHVPNPSNRDVRAVPRAEIRTLFPNCTLRMQRVTLAPPLTRLLAPISTVACDLLLLFPFLRTHTLASIRPR